VLFGVIALLWHDSDSWQTLRHIWSLPSGAVLGGCLMILQIAGGIGIQFPRTIRVASIVLGIVYFCFALACISAILAAPATYAPYSSFFEQVASVCGAMALYAATGEHCARAVALGRLARLGLGLCAVSFALSQWVYLSATASLVPHWIPPGQRFWAILTTIAFALAAIALLFNRRARLAARLLTLMLLLFGALVWIPCLIAHPRAHLNWSECALTFLITGAAWIVADSKSSR